MDKYEYKVRADEIKELIAQGEYAQAAEIADTIDWRRVKSVMMLCTISDLYKINRRYEDARDMLLLAYERRPGGRTICYSLCELSIKMEEYVQAVEYYKEFVQIAPKDSGRYILQYKLYEAQDVSLEERIAVLEELKKKDYREKWAYELAYLYHRVGLGTRCVEECDELILWFGEGKYVVKALELKMLHHPLDPEQQLLYDRRFEPAAVQEAVQEQDYAQNDDEAVYSSEQGYEGAQEYFPADETLGDTHVYPGPGNSAFDGTMAESFMGEMPVEADYGIDAENIQRMNPEAEAYAYVQEHRYEESASVLDDDLDIHVKTMDVGQYNTINLQAELAEGLKEVLGDETGRANKNETITGAVSDPMMPSDPEAFRDSREEVGKQDLETEEIQETEVFFGETGEIGDLQTKTQEMTEILLTEEEAVLPGEDIAEESIEEAPVLDCTGELVMEQMRLENADPGVQEALHAEPPKELAKVLSQEADGQIRLVMPESGNLEKQITGQMNIQDVLAEWERMKKENQEKREEELRRHVRQQTGRMFTDFEASVRDGLLEQLENGAVDLGNAGEVFTDAQESFVDEESFTDEESFSDAQDSFVDEDFTDVQEFLSDNEEAFADDMEPGIDGMDYEENPEDYDQVEELEEIQEEVQEAEFYDEDVSAAEDAESKPVEAQETASEPQNTEKPAAMEDGDEEAERQKETEQLTEPATEAQIVREKAKVRSLTREERELYAPFIQSKSAREQLVKAIDNISLAAYVGNVIITGEEGMDTLTLAKNMVREIQMMDSNFSGKVAKISGQALNQKNVQETVSRLKNGALIIEKASGMNGDTAKALHKTLQQEHMGIIILLEDTKKAMDKFLKLHEQLVPCFSARMDVEALSNDTLVAFGRQYAREMEYSIDELGILALHTRIEDLQTIDHVVTVVEVKEIVDEAIRHANKKTIGHFFDILFARRYDDEDMIILSENDFA